MYGGGYYFFGNPVTHQTTVREQTKQTKPITDTRNTYVVQAAKESGPAVVGITTQVFQKDIFNRTIYAGEGVGSGVLIDNDGHIVTNNHVVAGAKMERLQSPCPMDLPSQVQLSVQMPKQT